MHSIGRYHIFWHSTRVKWSECPDSFEDKAKAKAYATKFLKTHYLNDVTIAVRTPDGKDWIPLLIRRRILKDHKPYYGEWEECE